MKKINVLISPILILAMVVCAMAQTRQNRNPQSGAPRETLIQNATIMTASRGTITGFDPGS